MSGIRKFRTYNSQDWHEIVSMGIGTALSDLIHLLENPRNQKLVGEDNGEGVKPILEAFQRAITLVSEKVNEYSNDEGVGSVDFQREKSFFHDINDIREELRMIRRVLLQQEDVWRDFMMNAWPEYYQDGKFVVPQGKMEGETQTWRHILRPQTQFEKYRRKIAQLDEDAELVAESMLSMLDLKSKHAVMRESHSTGIMSAAVFGFTTITIIFTPLSFVASLFALPIDRFQRNQVSGIFTNETGIYPSSYIGKWSATAEIISVTIAVLAMWAAVKFGMHVPIEQRIWDALKRPFQKGGLENKDSEKRQPGRPARMPINEKGQPVEKHTSRFRKFARRRASKNPDPEG